MYYRLMLHLLHIYANPSHKPPPTSPTPPHQVMFNHLIKNQDLPKFRGCTMIDYISFMQVKHKQIPEIQ